MSKPPFIGGTAGFTSPEQAECMPSTTAEDLYGLGGLMTAMFCNLSPLKFYRKDLDRFSDNLYFFIGNRPISDLIASCYHDLPANRPSLQQIIREVSAYSTAIQAKPKNEAVRTTARLGATELRRLTIDAVNGLAVPEDQLIPFLKENELYAGLKSSVGGIFLALSLSKTCGFEEIEPETFERFGRFFRPGELPLLENLPTGLIDGSAGLAIILDSMQNLGFLPRSEYCRGHIWSCLDRPVENLTLYGGAAGQGIAMLQLSQWLQHASNLEKCVGLQQVILQNQLANGSWPVYAKTGNRRAAPGLANGVAGIVMFLTMFQRAYPNDETRNALKKGLDYLMRYYRRPWALKILHDGTLFTGTAGVAWTFLEAYRLDLNKAYKEIAEQLLMQLPKAPMWTEYGLPFGLTGLGWAYLFGAEVLGDPQLMERADHIANVLFHTSKPQNSGGCFWNTNGKEGGEYVDLLDGNAGIACFLLRYSKQRKPTFKAND